MGIAGEGPEAATKWLSLLEELKAMMDVLVVY